MFKKKSLPPGLKDPSEIESPEELAEATAAAMDLTATQYAHAVYWDKEFQKLARLSTLSQTEQDRIFNELVAGCIVLVMLSFEAPDLAVSDDMKRYFKKLREAMPQAHVKYLRSMGLKSKHLKDWKTLIEMRFEEYARDRHDVRSAAMKLETKDKNLDLRSLASIQLMVPLQAVAVGTHHHICRSKTDGRDDLFKCILNHLAKFYAEFRIRMQGGKITPLARARIALRRLFRRLQRRGGN